MAEAEIKRPAIREDGLQLEEHRAFQERFWTIERIAWVGFGVLVLTALLGFTGSGGLLATSTVTLAGGTIELPRVARWQSADEMVVHFAPGGGERRLALSTAFADALQVEGIQPQPQSSVAGPDGAALVFAAEAGAPAEVTIHFTPLHPGLPTFEASIDDGAAARLTMLVLP